MNFRLTVLMLIAGAPLFAQIGGNGTYAFLNLTNSARIASLGGKVVSLSEGDMTIAASNPAMLTPELNNNLSMNYVDYFAGIKFGYAAYAHKVDKKNTFAVGIQYINYGTFERADPTGQILGKFYAAEDALNLIWSHRIDSSFSLGVNFKPVYSTLDSYTSLGFATDLGVNYISKDKLFSGGLVLRNMGTQITRYTEMSGYERLPFEIVAGISQKLKYAPIRFYITAHQLQRPKLTYTDPAKVEVDQLTGEPIEKSKISMFGENFMRHIIVGAEFIPMKNFYLRAGYNYQRRKEMQIADRVGAVGFSWGFGIKINKFIINYGRATYHLAGASNHFSISVNLADFYKNRVVDTTY